MDRGGTVYLIDDDKSVRKGMGRLLRVAGYDVHVFSSAEGFLAVSHDPDACIVLDARMPGLSGIGLIKTVGLKLPVIFVTGEDSEEVRVRARAFGAAAFFLKPVDGQALINAIDQALETRSNG